MEVLVVDDEAIARRTVENALSEGGYRVFTAKNGREAMELLTRHQIQLVVIDWEMPVMNGLEFCKAVRSGDFPHYVYVIMVTSRDTLLDTISSFETGADDHITKPFNPAELIMRVNAGRRIVQLETSNMTIFALAKLAESRDPETGAHLERVRNYCRALAQFLASKNRFSDIVNDEFVDLIYRTSPLHDIGKVAIPDHILLKRGRLTKDEFEVMKTHTVRGAETIESLLDVFPRARFLQLAHAIILTHHEKWDGSGYPRGLAGEQIPLSGRIMALADVYDALTSSRVYKDASSHDAARSILIEGAGTHFDPVLIDAFLAIEKQFIAIRTQYEEMFKAAIEIPMGVCHV